MLHELRIITHEGLDVFSAKIENEANPVQLRPIEDSSIYAGFLSAALSIEEEVGRTRIEHFEYKSSRIYFISDKRFIYTFYCSNRIPSSDLKQFLRDIALDIQEKLPQLDGSFISKSEFELLSSIVLEMIDHHFWWTNPRVTMTHIINFLLDLKNLRRSYYLNKLPVSYTLFATIPVLILIGISFQMDSIFTGVGVKSVISADILYTPLIYLYFWLIPGVVMKLLLGKKFSLKSQIFNHGIAMILLVIVIILSSDIYTIWLTSFSSNIDIGSNSFLILVISDVVLHFLPLNLAFFGYFIVTFISGYFSNDIEISDFSKAYIVAIISVISTMESIPF